MDFRTRVGSNIKEHRLAQGLTQVELAHRSGVSVSQLGKVESAAVSMSIDTLEKIAFSLSVSAFDLSQIGRAHV